MFGSAIADHLFANDPIGAALGERRDSERGFGPTGPGMTEPSLM
jgi:hypothetical protein